MARTRQPLWCGTLCLLLLLLVADKTRSDEYPEDWRDWANDLTYYQGWNYGRNRLIREMRASIQKNEDTIKELNKQIQYIRNMTNLPLSKEERIAKLQCPDSQYITQINATQECLFVARRYSTITEAKDTCKSLGGHLAVLDLHTPDDFKNYGTSLIRIDWEQKARNPESKPFLSHNTFWIGDDNRITHVIHGILTTSLDIDQADAMCKVLQLDLYGEDHKLFEVPCDGKQRYPYLCEFDSGSEFILSEYSSNYGRICPDDFSYDKSSVECIYSSGYMSPFSWDDSSSETEFLDYSEADDFCAAMGSTLWHPKNLTALIAELSLQHSHFLKFSNLTEADLQQEYGYWLNESVRNDDLEWNALVQQAELNTNEGSNTNMCLVLKASYSREELYKGVAKCSSRQRFLCSINVHSKNAE